MFVDPIINIPPNDVSGRITNGVESVPHSIPYQAYLIITGSTGSRWLCGGSLISKKHVLTAGHCVDEWVEVYQHFISCWLIRFFSIQFPHASKLSPDVLAGHPRCWNMSHPLLLRFYFASSSHFSFKFHKFISSLLWLVQWLILIITPFLCLVYKWYSIFSENIFIRFFLTLKQISLCTTFFLGSSGVSAAVYLGSHNIQQIESTRVAIKSQNLIRHEDYNNKTYSDDIGVVVLSQPVNLNQYINVVDLPSSDATDDYEGKLVELQYLTYCQVLLLTLKISVLFKPRPFHCLNLEKAWVVFLHFFWSRCKRQSQRMGSDCWQRTHFRGSPRGQQYGDQQRQMQTNI